MEVETDHFPSLPCIRTYVHNVVVLLLLSTFSSFLLPLEVKCPLPPFSYSSRTHTKEDSPCAPFPCDGCVRRLRFPRKREEEEEDPGGKGTHFFLAKKSLMRPQISLIEGKKEETGGNKNYPLFNWRMEKVHGGGRGGKSRLLNAQFLFRRLRVHC